MDLYRIIDDLVTERNRLQRIIELLESTTKATVRTVQSRPLTPGRKSMSDKARKEVSARMKLYWAKRRASDGKANSG